MEGTNTPGPNVCSGPVVLIVVCAGYWYNRPTSSDDRTLLKLTPFCDWLHDKIAEIKCAIVVFLITVLPSKVNPEPSKGQDSWENSIFKFIHSLKHFQWHNKAEQMTSISWNNQEDPNCNGTPPFKSSYCDSTPDPSFLHKGTELTAHSLDDKIPKRIFRGLASFRVIQKALSDWVFTKMEILLTRFGCLTDHCSSEVIGPELSRQHSREAQVINASQNCETMQKCCETPISRCRGDTLPSSGSSDFSSKFNSSLPITLGTTTSNTSTHEVNSSHSDSNPKDDRECGNSDSSGSSSTRTLHANSSDSNKCHVLFTTQQSHNSVNEPDTEVDELASNGAVQGQTETNGGAKNEQFVSPKGICDVSGAGGNDSPGQESTSPSKHTDERELRPGSEGAVKRSSCGLHLKYPVQESGLSCGSDIVVAVSTIPKRIGLVIGSDMYVYM